MNPQVASSNHRDGELNCFPRGPRPTRHPAVVGALEYLGSGRVTRNGYLKPLKQNVVDVFVTKGTLTRALDLASRLYLALEERGHRVVLAPRDAHLYGTSLDPSGRDGASGIWDGESWSPRRPTVVYIGTVAIGLTLYEWSEEVEVRYQNGEYHRVTTKSVVPGRRTLPDPLTWTTQRHLPSGHLGLRAYSADHRSTWKMEWREEKERELKGMLDAIVRELERAAVVVARLIEEGEQRAQEERRRWEAADRERRRQEEERRRVQAHKDSREQLLAIVDGWVLASNIESFFQNALRGVDGLEVEAKEILVSRLERARRMFGGTDALRHFEHWKSPEER